MLNPFKAFNHKSSGGFFLIFFGNRWLLLAAKRCIPIVKYLSIFIFTILQEEQIYFHSCTFGCISNNSDLPYKALTSNSLKYFFFFKLPNQRCFFTQSPINTFTFPRPHFSELTLSWLFLLFHNLYHFYCNILCVSLVRVPQP